MPELVVGELYFLEIPVGEDGAVVFISLVRFESQDNSEIVFDKVIIPRDVGFSAKLVGDF